MKFSVDWSILTSLLVPYATCKLLENFLNIYLSTKLKRYEYLEYEFFQHEKFPNYGISWAYIVTEMKHLVNIKKIG